MNDKFSDRHSSNFKFGFLSTISAPLLPHILKSALYNDCNNIFVICDSKITSERDMKIWQERTGGVFEKTSSEIINIYNFGKSMIPFFFVDSHNGKQTIDIIKTFDIDCLFNAGTPRRLSRKIIDSVEHGVVNIHPGILPEYRGCTCVEWAIYNDEKIGNTAHFMDEGYDTGPIITSECYEFSKNATYQAIRVKVYQEGCLLAGRVLSEIKKHKIRPSDGLKQNPEKGQFWSPIPEDKMSVALHKLQNSEYKYQIL